MDYSSSGAVSTSVSVASGCSTEAMDGLQERKRKRMLSNRESARRSRQRKRSHLDDLAAQAARLRRENGHALAALAAAARGILAVESENSVLRARLMELAARLRSLDHILLLYNMDRYSCELHNCFGDANAIAERWNQHQHQHQHVVVNVQPLATEMFQYC